jgi:hypothetical protein
MRRYIRATRTRRNIRRTSALRDQFLRQLTAEAEALMQQWHAQFAQSIETQAQSALRGIVSGDGTLGSPGAETLGRPEPGTLGSFGQLLASGVRYLVSRPRTRRSEAETGRSVEADRQFRLSRAQTAAEAQAALERGERNR